MAWTAPRDWTDEELLDATIMNAHIRDNLRYLKGLDGVPTIESGLIIDNTGGDEYLLLPSLTTAERNALSAVNGMMVYNETTNAIDGYQNSSWGVLGITDHGGLSGLSDDDHTQYLKLAHPYTYTEATAGEQVLKITATDSVNQSAGMLQTILVDHNITGTKSSTASSEGISVDMNLGSTIISAYAFASYVSKTGDPDISVVEGMNIYLEDMGSGTVGNIMALDIGLQGTNLATGRHTGMRIRSHGGTPKSAIDIEATFTVGLDLYNGVTPADIATADIRFHHGATLLDDGTSLTLAGANFVSTLGATTLASDITGGGYDLDNIGHIGLGNNAATALDGILYSETTAVTGNYAQTGVDVYLEAYKTSAVYTNILSALFFSVAIGASNTQNFTNPIGLRGVYGEVRLETGTASSSTITGAAAFYADGAFGGAANDMVLTKYFGLYVATQTLVGNSKLTEDYGIYIANQAGGATLNYAIYTNDGLVRFGDTTDLCAGKAVFYSWGAVFADDYYLYMQSDYSSYVVGLDSGYLDLGANTGIRMRVGASGVVMTMLAQTLSIFPATFFSQVVEMGSYLRLKITDVDSADEADIWYDASEDVIKLCKGGASVDTLATTANISTHAALTATHGVSGAIVGTTDSQALTNKSYNGLTLTSTTGTFTLASGKTFTVSNTLTLTATDTATLAIGAGGTLGSAAYTASTDYVAKATYDAHSILIAINDNSPVKLDVAASRMIGRASSGNIVALAKADILTLINVTEAADVTGSNTCDTPGGADTDTTAIHDNTANEITAITLKGTPVAADEVVFEDSAASYVKKSATIGTLGSGIKLDDLATPDDVVDLNSSTTEHGLLKKLDNTATNYMDGEGNWSVPAGGAALSSITNSETFDLSTASGDASYTGYGFEPDLIICFSGIELVADVFSFGMADAALTERNIAQSYAPLIRASATRFLFIETASGKYQRCVLKSMDADGFTLTWSKSGLPTGTLVMNVSAFG